MTDAPLLTVEHLSKRFQVGAPRVLINVLLGRGRRPETMLALDDVSFEVAAGEVLGVIGRNGAGKSTLLKLIAGVTRPTGGSLRRPRRVAPLIEVGAGFHPELTGRENVQINGQLLGLSAAEVRDCFDEIVDFAELRHAIDQPVRQYSSGMHMRLGFAVAVHTRPELLLVDEVLAVGDLPFQARCLERITALRDEGVGVVFISHDLTAVQNLCDRALVLERGRPVTLTSVPDALAAYYEVLASAPVEGAGLAESAATGDLELARLALTAPSGDQPSLWDPSAPAVLHLGLRAVRATPEAVFGFRLLRQSGGLVAGWMASSGPFVPPLTAGQEIELGVPLSLNVGSGLYVLEVAVASSDFKTMLAHDYHTLRFGVGSRPGAAGEVDLSPSLQLGPVVDG